MFPIGSKVRLTSDVDVFPYGIVRKGQTGRLDMVGAELLWVTLDEPHEFLNEWVNKLAICRDDWTALPLERVE